ncbi:MAG: 4-hydroxy-tetrahydrodipicolinate reductase, partial [Chitinophagaceae bacterium]|nr:4-hydroxy-tetrahydrodipicolinate reductase [Chitinophagaceae bacterium]
LKVGIENKEDLTREALQQADVAIEFTGPEAAFDNIAFALGAGVPVVSGSTGWLTRYAEACNACAAAKTGFLYASNFSLGVNIFFEINTLLARLMASHTEYRAGITEVHHTAKLDAPSGTAITLAGQILEANPGLTGWVNGTQAGPGELAIESIRHDPAPGTHTIQYQSAVDTISITHEAHSRTGFALGAVLAAEFLQGRQGIYNMRHVLGLNNA